MYHHLPQTFEYLLTRCLWYMPGLVLFVALALLIYAWRRRFDMLTVLFYPALVLGFNTYALFSGSSEGWFRYYSSSIILGLAALGLIIAAVRRGFARRRWPRFLLSLVLVLMAAVSIPSTYLAMANHAMRADETGMLDAFFQRHTAAAANDEWSSDRAMAAYIDGLHLQEGEVVADTTTDFSVVVFSQNPRQFVISSDFDFLETFNQLPSFPGYVLISTRKATSSALIQQQYPGLLNNSVAWAHLRKKIGPWLFYRLAQPQPTRE